VKELFRIAEVPRRRGAGAVAAAVDYGTGSGPAGPTVQAAVDRGVNVRAGAFRAAVLVELA